MAVNFSVSTIFKGVDKMSKVFSKISANGMNAFNKIGGSLERTNRRFKKLKKAGSGLIDKIFNLRNAFLAIGASMILKKTTDLVFAQAKLGDEIAKTSRMLGISAEALQELRFAADRQGVSNALLTKSFIAMNKRVGELKAGTGSLFSFLKKTGNTVLLNQLKSAKNSEEVFNLLNQAISKTENPMKKAALASAAFSRAGVEMLKFMEAGEGGIKALRDEATKLGIVMSTKTANDSEKFVDAMTNLNASFMGVKNILGSELLPVLTKYITKVKDMIINNRQLIQAKIKDFFEIASIKIKEFTKFIKENISEIITVGKTLLILTGIFAAFKFILIAVEVALIASKIALGAFGVVMSFVNGLTKTQIALEKLSIAQLIAYKVASVAAAIVTKSMAAAQWLWNAAMTANPIGLIIVGISALVGVGILLVKHWDTVFNFFKKNWELISAGLFLLFPPLGLLAAAAGFIIDNWEPIKKFFIEFWENIKIGVQSFVNILKSLGKIIVDAVLSPIKGIISLLNKIPGLGGKFEVVTETLEKVSRDLEVPEDRKREIINPHLAATQIMKETTTRNFAEVKIKDETGRAEISQREGDLGLITMESTAGAL